MKKSLLFLLFTLLGAGVYAQPKTVVFEFKAGDGMFYGREVGGNDQKLQELFTFVDKYKSYFGEGKARVYVDAYSTSGGSERANKNLSFVRANRVKAELISQRSFLEKYFTTRNLTEKYNVAGDVVVVRVEVAQIQPVPEVKPEPKVEPEPEAPRVVEVVPEPTPKPEPVVEQPQPEPTPEPVVAQPAPKVLPTPEPQTKTWDSYCFAVRTNLLYDAMLVPNLGAEWRVNESWGVKVEGGGSNWGDEKGKVQKMWYVNPEVRYYLLANKRLYTGLGANYAKYNTYGYLIGTMFPKDTGYQGSLWNAGVVVGYQLPIGKAFAVDFNLGLGYAQLEYDSFTVSNDVRVIKEVNQKKGYVTPTQAGVSLVWKLGVNK